MLPADHRMRRSTDFSSVVRAGMRARAGTVVVHHRAPLTDPSGDPMMTGDPTMSRPLVGLVVSKSVGNSVVRHGVSRRLRAQLTLRLHLLPETSGTVIRALPAAATASSAELGRDLDRTLTRLLPSPASSDARIGAR